MKRFIVMVLVSAIVLSSIPVAYAGFPFEDFLLKGNERIIAEGEDNGTVVNATKIESEETVYGRFDLPDGAPLPDYFDIDFYKFTLLRKSHVLFYAETETGEDNVFLTLWKDEEELVSAGAPVVLSTNVVRQLLYCTLEAGVYYLMVTEPIDDSKYNGLNYMCYFESITAGDKSEKQRIPSDGGLTNFKRERTYSYKFYDVSPTDWFVDSVITAYELGLVNGISDIAFNPQGELTLAETIALACRIHSIYHYNTSQFQQGFTWYQVYIDYAIQNGIIKAGEYKDYDAIATRAQFAGILAKALPKESLLGFNTVENGAIPDVSVNSEHAEAIYMLYRAGVLTGSDEKGTFEPNASIQRSAVAAIVSRMAVANERQAIMLLN